MNRFEDQTKSNNLPAPDMVEFVARGAIDKKKKKKYLRSILNPYLGNIDAVVLGCTHFPFAKRAIQQIVGNDVYVVDGGAGAARELRRLLEAKNERRKEKRIGKIEFLNSNSDPQEIELSRKLFELD